MTNRHAWPVRALILLSLWSLAAAATHQPAGGDFVLRHWSVDAGGGAAGAGDRIVHGVIGQPDPGRLAGGDYLLHGGFLVAPETSATETPELLFSDGFETTP